MSNYKVHPHDKCSVCSKPETYKDETKLRERLTVEARDGEDTGSILLKDWRHIFRKGRTKL